LVQLQRSSDDFGSPDVPSFGLVSLSPANAPLLMLVVPIAMVGRRWGLRRALAAAALAVALVGARTAIWGGQIGIVGYLSRATAFVSVATLAGSLQQQSDRRAEHATSSVSSARARHALTLLINGKKLPITPFSGPDRYNPITSGKLRVKARWQTDLQGTGYKVVISTTEPAARTYRTCSVGTPCLVPKLVSIARGQEMSWTVRIMKITARQRLILSGFMVCLIRK